MRRLSSLALAFVLGAMWVTTAAAENYWRVEYDRAPGRYMVTLPDPGDYLRALAGEDEIILSVPAARIEELISSLREFEGRETSYARAGMLMLPDFPQPPMYQTFFKRWGLYEEDKDKGEKK